MLSVRQPSASDRPRQFVGVFTVYKNTRRPLSNVGCACCELPTPYKLVAASQCSNSRGCAQSLAAPQAPLFFPFKNTKLFSVYRNSRRSQSKIGRTIFRLTRGILKTSAFRGARCSASDFPELEERIDTLIESLSAREGGLFIAGFSSGSQPQHCGRAPASISAFASSSTSSETLVTVSASLRSASSTVGNVGQRFGGRQRHFDTRDQALCGPLTHSSLHFTRVASSL